VAALVVGWLAVCATGCSPRQADSEVHLIPEGYVGPVYVVYDQPDGASTRDERGWRVYEVGPDGIHLSAFEPNTGRLQGWEYYYVGPDGRRRLPSYSWSFARTEADSTFAVWVGALGGTGGDRKDGRGLTFYEYFVGTAADFKRWAEDRTVGDMERAFKERGVVWD
jgi:hypothetical protein